MAEIKRTPVKIVVGEVEYDCFDEDHTLSDIARWAFQMSRADAEELRGVLDRMLAEG